MLSVSLTWTKLENIAKTLVKCEVQISLNIYSLQIDSTSEDVKDQSEPLLPLLLDLKSCI